MSEHRAAVRTRTLLPARIEIPGLGVRVDCTIRDLSDTGARIQLQGGITVPTAFDLHILKFDRRVRAVVRWRRGDSLGLEFEAEEELPETVRDARYVRKLEEEIARLKLLLEAIREDPMRARMLLDQAA